MLFSSKPRRLVIGAVAVMEMFIVAWRTFVEHHFPIGGGVLVLLLTWLTVRQWKAKQRYPDGYTWSET